MAQASTFHFHDNDTLVDRLSKGLTRRPQEVVFLVGAPLAAPAGPAAAGVPGVDGVIDLIRAEFLADVDESAAFETAVLNAGERRYQAAFVFLQGRRGQQSANEIIRAAVRASRVLGAVDALADSEDESCRLLEADGLGWTLGPGMESLGKLAVEYPDRFGRSILTTNFDPLIEISIRRSGGQFYRTTLHSDGNLGQTEASGCHVVHLHGYWYGSDTLHTNRQLGQARPKLRASLASLLRNKLVVVCGYSGWDDAFTEAMMEVVRDDSAYPEIIWSFFDSNPLIRPQLASRLDPGIDRGRVTFYSEIDCNKFFPALHEAWRRLAPVSGKLRALPSNPVRAGETLSPQVRRMASRPLVIEGDDADRPPVVEICVGRTREFELLDHTLARVAFITGIGGQGKSTLASQYFTTAQTQKGFSVFVWRDCKEESERFESQLASVVEKLSNGAIRGEELAKQSAASVVEMLLRQIEDVPVLFVFDNVDNYVDLESGRLTAAPHLLVEGLLSTTMKARVIFTCRPSVSYEDPAALSVPLAGISLEAALELFERRGAAASVKELSEAHSLTEGHAFWLDLLAIQASKQMPSGGISGLLAEIRSGGKGFLPEKTLQSVWDTLKEREQVVLRAMAETVKADTEAEIGDYVRGTLNYNKVIKSLKALRSLNLVVVKKRAKSADVLELHPLVRQFIRTRFPKKDRVAFIVKIIAVYRAFRGANKALLARQPPLVTLQRWTQNAELDIAAGRFDDAFATLAEVAAPFAASAHSREYCRAARLLFSVCDWPKDHVSYRDFGPVFRTQVRLLSYLGEHEEVDRLLDKFERSVSKKDVRYVDYSEMRAYSKWIRGDLTSAVEWGRVSQGLVLSGIETKVDVAHTLALVERDSGQPDVALPIFLNGETLSSVTDPDELSEQRQGPFYGNVGRCLHLMGQVDSALVCYQKSALLIEKEFLQEQVINQGYIRAWVGELLVARGQLKLGDVFFRAAVQKWKHVFPSRAAKIRELSKQLQSRLMGGLAVDDADVERLCTEWIYGRSVDT